QPSALSPLVGAAADRLPPALQQRLPRGHDELFVRHRALALGARDLGGVARTRHGFASCRIKSVRIGAVLLSSVRRRGLRARPVRIRTAKAAGSTRTQAARVAVRASGPAAVARLG